MMIVALFLPLLPLLALPSLELPLSTSPNHHHLLTTLTLSSSSLPLLLNLTTHPITICCKPKYTLPQQIYYFLLNPYHQSQDYPCHTPTQQHHHDTASFPKIGPIDLTFTEIAYPQCQHGMLGMGQSSKFIELLPQGEWFIIEHDRSSGDGYQLRIGGEQPNKIEYFPTLNHREWAIPAKQVFSNEVQLTPASIVLHSSLPALSLPTSAHQLLTAQLTLLHECLPSPPYSLHCPCSAGIPPSYPSFTFRLSHNTTLTIPPHKYLNQLDQICALSLTPTFQPQYRINILLLEQVDIVFDMTQHRIGIAPSSHKMNNGQVENQPIQLILNSMVMLILCLFVGMLAIQAIKSVSGIQQAQHLTFQQYMRAEQQST